MDKFFDSNNPVMKFLSRLVDLAVLNILTVSASILIITAGGAIAAMNHVLLHLVRGDETYVTRMFWTSFKKNFKQGIPEGILALVLAGVGTVDLLALRGSESKTATLMMIAISVIAVFIFVMCIYMFALQSRYENTVKGTIINAVTLTVGNLPKSIAMAFIWIIWILVLVYLHRAASTFFLIFGLTLPGYLCAMLYDKIFIKLESE